MVKIIGFIAALFFVVSAGAVVEQSSDGGSNQPLTGELPWPFGTEIPFPWDDIDGIWMGQTSDGQTVAYFSLRECAKSRDERTLEIFELSLDFGAFSFTVLSKGQGVESQKIVRGQMVDQGGPGRYRFSIRAFDDENDQALEQNIARVITITPVDPTDQRNLSFVLFRVSDLPLDPPLDKNLASSRNCGSTSP